MHISRVARSIGYVAILFLAGCATKPAVLEGFQDHPSPIDLKIIDSRPADDKESEWLSLIVTSCDYGIRRWGDETTIPPKLTLLRRDLEDTLNNQLSNATITVSKYAIFFNGSAGLRHTVYSGSIGIVPAIMESMGSNCSKEETTGGWYAASEVTNSHSPIVIEIEAAFEGKNYNVRTVYSPEEELPVTGGLESASALFAAIHKANAALIDQIRSPKPKT